MKELKLSHAIVIAAVLLVLGGLSWAGKDSAAVVGGLLAVLGAMGMLVKQNSEVKEQQAALKEQGIAIKEQTNGNQKELLGIIARQHEDLVRLSNRLADMQPPSPPSSPRD